MMRHDCQTGGCYLHRHVLKFDAFADCFPNKMNFTDVDASIEYRGFFLDMEWKEDASQITQGQTIYFQNKTKYAGFCAIEVIGSASNMQVAGFRIWWWGKVSKWIYF